MRIKKLECLQSMVLCRVLKTFLVKIGYILNYYFLTTFLMIQGLNFSFLK